jgi:hypothetical protein
MCKDAGVIERGLEFVERHWRWLVVASWLGLCAWLLFSRWGNIQGFVLNDTDDNMRMAQVRAWLNDGQGWYDLRQYKLDWPEGANIHWSRFVDLPLAALIVLGRLFLSGGQAEQFAIAVAPMLPLALLMTAMTLTIRRLIDPRAWPLIVPCLFFAAAGFAQFAPTRIDHHGWQLALLALGVSGIADPRKARGGATLGIASAASLAIGLEMMIYIVVSGAVMVVSWIADASERRRLATYAVTLAGGTALAFVLFASEVNRLAVCDALSPVWLSDALLGGALLVLLAWWTPGSWKARLAAAAIAGLAMSAFHALAWPNCLTRLEGVSDETNRLWLSHVREARPITKHGWRFAILILALPVASLAGWGLLAWTVRKDSERLRRTIGAALPGIAATALLFWQSRTGPAAQLMSIPGAIALIVVAVPMVIRSRFMLVRTLGVVVVVLMALGALAPLVIDAVAPDKPDTARDKMVGKANRSCPTLAAMAPLQKMPPATIFTFADLSPRLITITHHRAIAGPYHRNGEAIVDSMKLFRGSPDEARAILAKYRADYLMTCPMMSQATVFESEAPKGFYVQLEKGKVPDWLEPVDMPNGSPLRLWRVKN